MPDYQILAPASQLAATNMVHFTNESADYRAARNVLLVEEIELRRHRVWWYKFYFAGQEIRESSKSTSKTVAKNAEQQRRRELEVGYNNGDGVAMMYTQMRHQLQGLIVAT
jgi:hypothetical protein